MDDDDDDDDDNDKTDLSSVMTEVLHRVRIDRRCTMRRARSPWQQRARVGHVWHRRFWRRSRECRRLRSPVEYDGGIWRSFHDECRSTSRLSGLTDSSACI